VAGANSREVKRKRETMAMEKKDTQKTKEKQSLDSRSLLLLPRDLPPVSSSSFFLFLEIFVCLFFFFFFY
jgi:hypothetical protein